MIRRWFASLYGRMLALSAAATLIALGLAGWTMSGVLERFVIEGLDRRLDSQIAILSGSVDAAGHVDRRWLAERQGALAEGPGWRWRIAGPDGTIGSADFPVLADGPPGPPGPDQGRPRPRDGAAENGVAVHARELVLQTGGGTVRLTAAAPRDVIARPIRGAVAPLLAALAALALVLVTASWAQLRLGLAPLRRLRDEVAAIRAGQRSRVDEDVPSELRGLAEELNALTEANAAALAGARQSAANLAHALKTPVAALAIALRRDPDLAAQVARIDATIRHHLARARVQAADQRASTALAPAVDDLVATVARLHGGRGIAIATRIEPGIAVAVDAHDLDEMIGNLLDNAAKFARQRVAVTAERDAGDARTVRIVVCDDGPGIPAERRTVALEPGQRLDERVEGHGFGLSIVRELAELYGGTLSLGTGDMGGLLAELQLPARPA
ncbi:histidine kinase [Sphingomonas metalli]|uniref:histidine kinase n=1 Tax=Sphingomonas metalli TaxID=1779358 RepID=A0A916T4R2_9SPHN|nr:ATP-binding protein [Sphingomonas metalli]GGB31479.1 histidine kinase [Sphingomonas metalli]